MNKQYFAEKIVSILLNSEKPISIKRISETLNVSEKSVWNELNSDRLNAFLGGLELVKKPHVGIFINGTKQEKLNLKELFNYKRQCITTMGKDIRENCILIDLFKASNPITAKDLSEKYFVSRSSTVNELDMIAQKLNGRGIEISRKQNVGYWLKGDESSLRQYLEKFIIRNGCKSFGIQKQNSKYPELSNELYSVIIFVYPFLDIGKAINIIGCVQRTLLGNFTAESFKEIVAQILVTKNRYDKGFIIENENNLIDSSTKYQNFVSIFEHYDLVLSKSDYQFLWKKCISSRFQSNDNLKMNDKFLMFAQDLLKTILVTNNEEGIEYLVYELAFHILQAAKRSNYGITTYNPILDRIKNQYGEFYAMVLTNINDFEEKYKISLNEDEIGYITIYVCAIAEKILSEKFFKLLVVCDEGMGQSALIKTKLCKEFNNIKTIDQVSGTKLTENLLNEHDIIISSVENDRLKKFRTKLVYVDDVIDDKAVAEIKKLMDQIGRDYAGRSPCSLSRLEVDFKYFQDEQLNRTDVIKKYTSLANKLGYVSQQYCQSVIDRENRASTSIGKGIAIPHANTKFINRQAIFIVKNAVPIMWGNELVDTMMFLMLKFENINENKRFFYRLYSCLATPDMIKNIQTNEDLLKLKKFLLEEGDS